MTTVAVIAHTGKSLGGGLDELRSVLAHEGVDALWYEVPKSRKATKRVREAVDLGADLLFVWGGDGMVRRCVDGLTGGRDADIAIVPAGTANLLATNLGVPEDIEAAVAIGLRGRRRRLDAGVVNGERFAVMAGCGFDALMIRDADAGLKERTGRLAYLWSAARNVRVPRVGMRVRVDGSEWFDGEATCLLVGNVGTITGGLTAFERAKPDDGVLEVGVVTASGAMQWSRLLARLTAGRVEQSPLARQTSGRTIDVKLDKKLPYELDGGVRGKTTRLKIHTEPSAISLCVPNEEVA